MEFFLPQPTEEERLQHELAALRELRSRYLAETDWTQIADNGLTNEKRMEWQTYRQALRDITDSYTSLDDVVWPTKP